MSKKREHHKLFMVGSDAPFQFTEAYKSLRTNLSSLPQPAIARLS